MDEPWVLEERMWRGGGVAFGAAMAPDCLMAFAPVGILRNQAIVEGLEQAPRWSEIRMNQRITATPSADTMVLAYRATARREGAEPYEAWCTSTYIRLGGRWKIVQHQQSQILQD